MSIMDYFSIQLLLVITPGGKAMHQSDFCLEKGDCYSLAASGMSMIPSSSMPNNCSGSLLQSLDLTETKKRQTDSTHIEQKRFSKNPCSRVRYRSCLTLRTLLSGIYANLQILLFFPS